MPYIKTDQRPAIDELLQPLIENFKQVPLEKQDGAINYTITKILKAIYAEGNYFTWNRSMGTLSAIQHEWYRRFIAPYEDQKIKENGDV
ncbi:MAG TPA: hypothetical protein VLG37_04175 [Candidatus Saccharimonadales bacterium]|nr:hypothetical protein [Candidatus Saccharimonadales bacterium]